MLDVVGSVKGVGGSGAWRRRRRATAGAARHTLLSLLLIRVGFVQLSTTFY